MAFIAIEEVPKGVSFDDNLITAPFFSVPDLPGT